MRKVMMQDAKVAGCASQKQGVLDNVWDQYSVHEARRMDAAYQMQQLVPMLPAARPHVEFPLEKASNVWRQRL